MFSPSCSQHTQKFVLLLTGRLMVTFPNLRHDKDHEHGEMGGEDEQHKLGLAVG
jgi:hypothetical protein